MSDETKTIACVAYPGTSLLELTGLYSTLVGIQQKKHYRLHVVGQQAGPIDSDTPLPVVADKTFDDLPHPSMLFITGSGSALPTALNDETLLNYLRSASQSAELIGSIGTGSLALAEAGLLQSRQATTHWAYVDRLEQLGAHYVRQPWVEDDRLITGAGVSSSADMGLHLVDKYTGRSFARQLQILAEYDPCPPFGGIDWNQPDFQPPSDPPMPAEKKQLAFVIYPGLTPLDLIGPLGVLSAFTKFAPEYETVVVAEQVDPIRSDNGLTFIPQNTFDQVPHPYAIIVPGGGDPTIKAIFHPAIRRYVRSAAQTAEMIVSVCTGALILAGVGLLEGRPATTHWAYYKVLERLGSPYRRQRWIENGKVLNSAGVSAGIDAALALVARFTTEATARQVQLAIQYDPQPPFGRVDWDHLSWLSRVYRAYYSLKAPFIASRARRLIQQGA